MPASQDAPQAEALARMAEQEREFATEWVKRVILALKAGNDALAREAMERSLAHVEAAARHEEELARLEGRPPPTGAAIHEVGAAVEALQRKLGLAMLPPPAVQMPHGLQELIEALLALEPKKRDDN